MSAKKPALGRGLEALFVSGKNPQATQNPTQAAPEPSAAGLRSIGIERIKPNPHQPRRNFDPDKLTELAGSIKETGILQPIVVRGKGDIFEIVAGERRWRAAQLAGLKEVPVIVKEFDDRMMTLAAIIENVQRENLNPIEEAHGYESLITDFNLTQDEVAARVGKSRVAITNALRILKLPQPVIEMIKAEQLSAGHARAILAADGTARQIDIARTVMDKGLSVRETERMAREKARPAASGAASGKARTGLPADARHLEQELTKHLGLKIKLHPESDSKGWFEIHYATIDDFEGFCQRIGFDLGDSI